MTRSSSGPISRLLSPGCENALTRAELEALTGWSGREVRKQIERERRNGELILSDNRHGYYLPASDAEVTACIRSLRNRAGEILRTARRMDKAYGEREK